MNADELLSASICVYRRFLIFLYFLGALGVLGGSMNLVKRKEGAGVGTTRLAGRLEDDHDEEAAGDGGEEEAEAEEDVDQEGKADGSFAQGGAERDKGDDRRSQIGERIDGEDFVADRFDLGGRLDDADEADGGEADAEHTG
jgi:hypothetical protein